MTKLLSPQTTNTDKSAFTLIELLVVIAIIAILAAILFPVFARARENARRSSCQSNLKQISLGMLQYMDDFDGTITPWRYDDPSKNVPRHTWVRLLNPYMKEYTVFHCPSDSRDPYGIWGGSNSAFFGNYQSFGSYGLNVNYLNPSVYNSATGCGPITQVKQSEIANSSETVMVADSKVLGNDTDGYSASSYIIESPAIATDDIRCGYFAGGGWGTGSSADNPARGGLPADSGSTGFFSPRHLEGGNVAFMDGHVKWFTPGRLAQGTNWSRTTPNASVAITNRPIYLWDTE